MKNRFLAIILLKKVVFFNVIFDIFCKICKKSPKKSAFFGRFYGFIDDFHNENRPKSDLSGPVKSMIFWIFLDFDQNFCDFLQKMAIFEGRF